MGSRQRTPYESATTPLGEDLLAIDELRRDIEALADKVGRFMPESDRDLACAALRDACGMLAVLQGEETQARLLEKYRAQIVADVAAALTEGRSSD